MRTRILLAIVSLCSLAALAADKLVPPNVRIGLWETTETHKMAGMPTMPSIPPDALAKMTPEQRALIEARMQTMSNGQKPTTRKYCLTQEKLDEDMAFGQERNECTREIVSSSSTTTEVKIHCKEKDATSDGTFKFVALSPDNVKGTMHMVATTSKGQTMNMDFDMVSKYLGPSCGDVK